MATGGVGGGAQTVDRALEVLRQVVMAGEPVLLEDLAARVGVSSSITYRLVRSLENAGYIRRDPRQGGYVVGSTFISMSLMTANRIGIGRTVRPVMDAIVREYGETVSFHVRSGMQRVCIEVAEGVHEIRRVIPVGETLPLYAGETGRVLSSDLPDDELAALIATGADEGLDIPAFRDELAQVRQDGYIIGVGMRTSGVGSISVAIYGPTGILGAMTISGPADRWNPSAMQAAVPSILENVRSIAPTLGSPAA